jgi:Rrf2 family iron-sulfur cluster assembly transcriptional regulator
MKLSKKGRYAVTAMMDLALHSNQGPFTLANISFSQEISVSYMEQLFAMLRKHGLVVGTRGPGGGYRLARPVENITIAEILNAVEDGVTPLYSEHTNLPSHALWNKLSHKIYDFLADLSLAEFIAQSGQTTSLADTSSQQGANTEAGVTDKTNTPEHMLD